MAKKKRKLCCVVCSRQWEVELDASVSEVECSDCGYVIQLPWEPPPSWPYDGA